MVRRKPQGHETGGCDGTVKGMRQMGIKGVGKWLGSRFATPCTYPLAYHRKAHGLTVLIFMPSPRMLVGAPWDGPSGDRRGDIYRCPVGSSHNASCAKGHLGKMPHSSAPNP